MPLEAKQTEPQRPVRSLRLRKSHTLLGLLALAIVFVLVAWWRLVSDDVVMTIPNPVMPNPNALDFYIAAGNGIVNRTQVDAAIVRKPFGVLGGFGGPKGAPQSSAIKQPVAAATLAQKEALLQQNTGALQSLHQGFAYEYRNPPVLSMATRMPPYGLLRRITRLLELQYEVREAQGDWGGAAESALDAVRLGEDIPRGGGLIAHSVGIACEMNGERLMWETIAHLNAAQSRAAAQRLEAIMDRHVPYADTIQAEKWAGVALLKDLFRSIKPREVLSDASDFVGQDASASRRYRTAFYLLYGKKRVLKSYIEFMDAVSEGVRKPYALKMLPPPRPDDPINDMMIPIFANARTSDVNARTQNGLLLAELALHAHRLEHGHYPISLAELAPTYLKKTPDDPFAMQGTFVYRLQGNRYLLYSIGPDGKDDGGKPINNPQSASTSDPQARYHVKSDSIGDIVAGINLP